jgi:hypothetical protein
LIAFSTVNLGVRISGARTAVSISDIAYYREALHELRLVCVVIEILPVYLSTSTQEHFEFPLTTGYGSFKVP